jgi:hypothetical protein
MDDTEVVEVGSTKVVSEKEVARTIRIRKTKDMGALVSVEEEKMEKVEPKD